MIDDTLKQMRQVVERHIGARAAAKVQLRTTMDSRQVAVELCQRLAQAQTIIQVVAQQTQKQLEYRVSELVSLAQSSIFDDPWALQLDFVMRRNRTECDLLWSKADGRQSKNINFSGAGGEEDAGALGLQFSMWALQNPRTRPFIMLDEPLKFLKGGELPARGAAMIKAISHSLGVQILMISHIVDQIEGADKIFDLNA